MSNQASAAADLALLDNPIFNSLVAAHARLAEGGALARRYRSEIGPLAGVREPSAEAFAELAMLVPENDVAVLFLDRRDDFPAGWEVVRDGTLVQMICTAVPSEPGLAEPIEPLGPADFAEMVALARLTEPGPFRDGTPAMGGFVGFRVDGRLAAMGGSGSRLSDSPR